MLYGQAMDIFEAEFGPASAEVAAVLNNVAEVNRELGQLDVALRDFDRALTIFKANPATQDAELAGVLCSKARVYADMKDFTRAEALFKESMAIVENTTHPNRVVVCSLYARFLAQIGRDDEAKKLSEFVKVLEQLYGFTVAS